MGFDGTGSMTDQIDKSSLLSQELNDLADSFRITLPSLLSEIESWLGKEDDRSRGVKQAIMIAHQIRGSAGTLGLTTVGCSFAVLEDQLKLIEQQQSWEVEEAKAALRTTLELCRFLVGDDDTTNHSQLVGRPTTLYSADSDSEELAKVVDEGQQLVLLVEDDPVFVEIVRTVLRSNEQPVSLFCAGSLTEALHLLSDCEPDIILLDLALPDSTGIATFHTVHDKAPDVPILILTAKDDTPIADESVSCGAQDFLVKGRMSPDALNRCIRYSIARSKAEQSLFRLSAIEDFITTLAHDLRVPAQGADRILKHILDGLVAPLTPQLKHALSVLNESNSSLLEKLNKLLNLYNLEFGSVRPQCDVVNLLPIIEDSLSKRNADIESKKLNVEWCCDKQPNAKSEVSAYTDAGLIQEVLDQLFDNAIKFAPVRDVLAINIESHEDAVSISISNHGKQIHSDDRKALFKKLWRGRPGVSYVAHSGLGLYYCHQIVKLLNGRISCRSNAKLTTFTLRLPANAIAADKAAPPDSKRRLNNIR